MKTKDEIGVLSNALNKMVEDLKEIITRTQDTTMHVVASSEELTASAEQSTQSNEVFTRLRINASHSRYPAHDSG